MADKRTERLEAIKNIIRNEVVTTQEELVAHLNDMGYLVTQATISRDIRELGLTKFTSANGDLQYRLPDEGVVVDRTKYVRILKESLVSMEDAQNILVIKTVSGMAMAAAAALDSLKVPYLVGCIAGDDTVMCVIKKTEYVSVVMDTLEQLIR